MSKPRHFTQVEAREMWNALNMIELALTAWGLPKRRKLWEHGKDELEIQIRVPLHFLRLLADNYSTLNELMNRTRP